IIILFARYASTAPLAKVINAVSRHLHPHRERDLIPKNHVLMLWWAGLRGAIAFALSFDIPGESGPALRTTTLVVCVLTVIGLGGTTNYALEKLNIKVGVGAKRAGPEGSATPYQDDEDDYGDDSADDEETDSSEDDVEDWDDDLPGSNATLSLERRYSENPEGSANSRRTSGETELSESRIQITREDGIPSRQRRNAQDHADMTHWFMSFDNAWLKPLFTRSRFASNWQYRRNSGVGSPTRQSLLRSQGESATSLGGNGIGLGNTGRNSIRRKGAGSASSLPHTTTAQPSAQRGSTRGFGKSTTLSPNIGPVGSTSSSPSSSRLGSLSAPMARPSRTNSGDDEGEKFVGLDGKAWSRPISAGGGGGNGGSGVGSGGARSSKGPTASVELTTKTKKEQS
ncbi:monovalent cation:H+ antiporter, CPA1 (nhx1), partial [Phlyctochytrium planicorne]